MDNKRLQKISVAALVISILPLAAFVPTLFNMVLTDIVRSIWAGVNIFSVFGDWYFLLSALKTEIAEA